MNKINSDNPVIIVGGGLAGLSAARHLHEKGVPIKLFEAGEKVAGLAQSFHDEEGFTYDFGAHFVTNRLADAIGVGEKCRDVPRYGETVWLSGRSYGYPFGLLRVPRYAISGLKSKLASILSGVKGKTAADWFRTAYGSRLADEIAIPLTEAWSGAEGEKLSAAVGESIPGSIFHTLYLKAASRVTKRAVSCGYSRDMPESPRVWHVYPDGGVGVLCEKLAEDIKGSVYLNSPVEEIIVEDNRVVGIKSKGEFHKASAVVSTAPANILPKLIKGTDKLDYLTRFRYRPMTFVNMRFEGRELLPDVVVWTPEEKYPFFRLTETPVSMPWLAPEGKTVITVDIGCEIGDAIWAMDEDALGNMCLESLESIIPDAKSRFLGCKVLKTPLAYPVFLEEYEEDRRRFERGTEVEGLYSIGRNGEFRHIFMEDAYWRTQRKMDEMLSSLSFETAAQVV
ncbi:MAG: FAD-dependent oxidoreductase [Pyrinomonadaceae bacterium]